MIIIKTTKGDAFVNENEIFIVEHDREHRQAIIRSAKDDLNCILNEVDAVIYTNKEYTTATESDTNSQPDYKSDSLDILYQEMTRLDKGYYTGGTATRFFNICQHKEINTIGELLEKGRKGISQLEGIGCKGLELASMALRNLYGIKTW